MSTTIEVTGVQPSTITVGRDLGFDPIVAALDSACLLYTSDAADE